MGKELSFLFSKPGYYLLMALGTCGLLAITQWKATHSKLPPRAASPAAWLQPPSTWFLGNPRQMREDGLRSALFPFHTLSPISVLSVTSISVYPKFPDPADKSQALLF